MSTVFLPVNHVLTITQPADSAGSYRRLGEPGGVIYSPVAMSAAEEVVLGVFDQPRNYEILSVHGNATLAVTDAYATQSEGITASDVELSYVDGVTSPIQTQIDAKKPIAVVTNNGAVEAGVTVVERGDEYNHVSMLTVASTLPAIPGGPAKGIGKLLYTLPAGAIVIDRAYINLAITQSEGFITADTPEVGLGTVIASGAVAVLSGTATFEDILTGQVAADCDGTATVKTVADQVLVIEAGDAHTVHLNVADTWAASGDAAAAIAGTVVLHWHFIE